MENEQQQSFATVTEIPQMPKVLFEVFEVIKNQNSSPKDLVDAINADPDFARKLIKLSNSRYFMAGQIINSVQKAIVILGMMKIKNMIMTLVLKDLMTINGSNSLWQHGVKCAVASKILASQFRVISEDDAYAIGFLHDLGKSMIYKEEYVSGHGADIIEFENNTYGTNHCMLGASILRKWRMPNILIDFVKYHHSPTLSSIPMACGLIYVADCLVQDTLDEELIANGIMERLGLSMLDTKSLRLEMLTKADILLNELNNA